MTYLLLLVLFFGTMYLVDFVKSDDDEFSEMR